MISKILDNPFNNDSIINGLMKEYYQHEFIDNLPKLEKSNLISIIKDFLIHFEKVDILFKMFEYSKIGFDLKIPGNALVNYISASKASEI